MTMLVGERSTLRPRSKRREIPRSGSPLGMSILVGCSLHFDPEGAVGGFIAVGHVAIPAAGLSRLERCSRFIELALRDQHIDLGKAVGRVESEAPNVVHRPGLAMAH